MPICNEGQVWLLSSVLLPQGRVPDHELRAEETKVTQHSTWVNFVVQREAIDAHYSATNLSKCLLEGQGEIL